MSYGPADAARHNIEFLGYTDQGDRGDGVQIMVQNAMPTLATCSAAG